MKKALTLKFIKAKEVLQTGKDIEREKRKRLRQRECVCERDKEKENIQRDGEEETE